MPLVSMLAALAMVGVGVVGWWLVKKKNSAGSNSTVQNASGAPAAAKVAPDGFEILFNGRDLSGWSGDPQHWSVQAEGITGYAERNARAPSSCLIWKGGEVQDFELHLAVLFKGGNSGVFYRGRDLGNWSVGGYQFELFSGTTGNLMENGTDRVTRDLARHQKGIDASFRKGEWNNVVITAQGNHLTHQINGQIVADVTDTAPSGPRSGILAFELYAGGSGGRTSVQFKDVRLKKLSPSVLAKAKPNPASSRAADGYEILFNGRDLTGWQGEPQAWSVEDGLLTGRYATSATGIRNSTALFYRGPVLDGFDLQLSFRSLGGSSDVLYRATEHENFFPTGYAYSIWWNVVGGIHEAMPGATRGLTQKPVASASRTAVPNEWHQLKIVAQGNQFRHELDGKLVADAYDQASHLRTGTLALSLHPNPSAIQFKDIRLKRF